MSLEAELALFNSKRVAWLKDHEGRYVLIKDDDVSFHNTAEAAYQVGFDRYGDVDFFIKPVLPEGTIEGSLALLYDLVNAPT